MLRPFTTRVYTKVVTIPKVRSFRDVSFETTTLQTYCTFKDETYLKRILSTQNTSNIEKKGTP